MSSKIPKIIHYCWFGPKPLGEIQRKCIESWRRKLPNFEFKLWNELNSDLEHPFTKAAYKAGKFAFVADFVRFSILYNEGGVYLDTDMLVLKTFNKELLEHEIFVGREDAEKINGAIIGSLPKQPFIKACLDSYSTKFDIEKLPELAIPNMMSRLLSFYPNVKVFPAIFFYPFPFSASIENPETYKKYIRPESYAVHLWDASWIDGMKEYRKEKKIWTRLKRFLGSIIK